MNARIAHFTSSPDLRRTFHISWAELAFYTFVITVAALAIALPVLSPAVSSVYQDAAAAVAP